MSFDAKAVIKLTLDPKYNDCTTLTRIARVMVLIIIRGRGHWIGYWETFTIRHRWSSENRPFSLARMDIRIFITQTRGREIDDLCRNQ